MNRLPDKAKRAAGVRGGLVGLAALILALLFVTPASGSEAWLDPFTVKYQAYWSETNRVAISDSPVLLSGADPVEFSDVVPIRAVWPKLHWFGCEEITDFRVWCAIERGPGFIKVWLHDGDDEAELTLPLGVGYRAWIYGGPGYDSILGGPGADGLHGGLDGDLLQGGSNNDYLYGEEGHDLLRGGDNTGWNGKGDGDDWFYGGPGVDTVDYSDRTTPNRVSLYDNYNNDGAGPGVEFDNVHSDVENVYGSQGRDDIEGDGAVDNTFFGNDGFDDLDGLGGDDWLYGGPGGDRLMGGVGSDMLDGGEGIDTLDGEAGNDEITSADGEYDYVKCGSGFDTVLADAFDYIFPGCEAVTW